MLALDREPMADGMESGIIVERGEDEIYREGSRLRRGDTLIGGWARVHRKDRRVAMTEDISLSDWNQGQAWWKKSPAYMIQKVAEVHALKKAFPGFLKKDIPQDTTLEIEGVTVESIEAEPIEQPVLEAPDDLQTDETIQQQAVSSDEPLTAGLFPADFDPNKPVFSDRGHFMEMAKEHLQISVNDVCAYLGVDKPQEIDSDNSFIPQWATLNDAYEHVEAGAAS